MKNYVTRRLKNQKNVPLNEKLRNQEAEESKKWRLEVENKRRVAKGEKPVTELSELDNFEDGDETEIEQNKETEKDGEPDPILVESENILVDYIRLISEDKQIAKKASGMSF